MATLVQPKRTSSSEKMTVHPVPVDSPEEAPSKKKATRDWFLYCDGSKCAFEWDKEPIDGGVRYVRNPLTGLILVFCQACYEKEQEKDLLKCPRQFCNPRNLMFMPRTDRLRCYEIFTSNGKKYLFTMATIVLLLPIVAVIQNTRVNKYFPKVSELWEHTSKSQVVVSFIMVYANFAAIVISFPFKSQVVFWSLLELYTVFFTILNILFRTPINGYVNVYDQYRASGDGQKFILAMYKGFPLQIFPGIGLMEMFQLIQTSVNVSILTSTARKMDIDLNKLEFIDSDTKERMPSSMIAGAFASAQSVAYRRKKLGWKLAILPVFGFGSLCLNAAIMISWVTNIAPSVDFLFHGAYSLVGSPSNAPYNITGTTVLSLCQAVSGSNNTAWTALWNMNIDPTPSAELGIPLFDLGFSLDSHNIPFTLDAAWNINLVNQTGTSVGLIPSVGQSTFSILGKFSNISGCSEILNELSVKSSATYNTPSIQQFVRSSSNRLGIYPIYLGVKHWMQFVILAITMANMTARLWFMWHQYLEITEMGLYESNTSTNPKNIDLTSFSTLISWLQLRRVVVASNHHFAIFVQAIISLSLAQLVISFAGLILYCITGTAPMPTYFLLIIGLVMSLSTLILLFPISEAIAIQASQGDKLRQVLVQHLLKNAQETSINPMASKLENYLKTFIDLIDNHDDRICFWGFEMSRERLQGLCVTLASGISFVASKSIEFSWSDTNPLYLSNPTQYILG